MKVAVASILRAAEKNACLVAKYMVFSWDGKQIEKPVNLEEKALQFAPKTLSLVC